MEGRKRSRKNTRQEWKRRVSSALAVVLTAAMVLNTPLSIDGLGGLHISNAFASGSNADRKEEIWATASNAKYKRGESQEVDIYVIAEDNEAVPDNSTFLTLYLRNNTGQMITEGSLTFKGNHIAQKDGYFQDMGTMEEGSSIIVVEGGETEASQEGQLVSEEPSGEGMIYQEPELEDQNQETALLPEEEAQPDSGNLPDEFDEEESEEIQDNENESEDENEAYELIGIDLQPGEMREIQFEFYTDEDEDSTKAYVEFTFRGDKEDGNRVKSDSKFYYSIGLPFVDLSLEEGTKIESGVSNDMEIWMNEPTWVDANLEERIEAQEEKEAEEEYEALEEAEEEDEVIASGSNAEKNKDQSLTEGKGAGQETASPSDADREEISQEQKDQEKINQYTQEAMKISESKVSYEIEIYGAEFERFSPRKAEEAEGLGWISCVYEVANHTEPGLYYGKVRANGRWNNEKFTSEQGFFFEVTGEGRTGQEYTADLNNMTVHAYAEEGVLPEYAKLQVTELSESNAETAEQFQKAVDALTQEGTAYDGMMAVDITFVDENGEEIEPEGEVQVSIEMKEGALPEGVDLSTVEVHHLKEVDEETVEVEAVADGADKTDGTVRSAEEIVTELEEAEASEEEIQAAVSEDAAAVAEFSVASFSTFTITWGNKGNKRSATVHYVDSSGKDIQGNRTRDVSADSDDWIDLDEYGTRIDGYTYQGAHLNTYYGTNVKWVKYEKNKGWSYSNSDSEPRGDGTEWDDTSERNIYLVYQRASLTTVDTVDSTAEGVHMYMFDYGNPANIGGPSYGSGDTKDGLASLTVNANGWPRTTQSNTLFSNFFGGTTNAYNLSEHLNNNGEEVNHLFLQSKFDEDGTFYYSSFENFATLKNDNDSNFTVYEELGSPDSGTDAGSYYFQRGNFFPYNTLNINRIINHNLYSDTGEALDRNDDRYNEEIYGFGETNNYYFGMYIWADFYQPKDGLVENNAGTSSKEMVFEFTGDDDMWVYIDGVLALDLGGIHDAQSGYINFATGQIGWTDTETGDDPDWNYTNLKSMFQTAGRQDAVDWDGNTFIDGSNHRIQIFYMERGAGASNLKISFNLKTIPDGQLAVHKNVQNYYAPQLANITYTMQVEVNGEPYANQPYTFYESEGGGTTDSNGQFTLKNNQTANFANLTADDVVVVKEVGTSDTPEGSSIDQNYKINYTVTDGAGNTTGDVGDDGTVTATMPGYGSIQVRVTNTAKFTRPLKLVKNFSGTVNNTAPEDFQATYTLFEVDEEGNRKFVGNIRYSDMDETDDNKSASYIFWLDTDKKYTIVESFENEDGKDTEGNTETLFWQTVTTDTNDAAVDTDRSEGIIYLETNDETDLNSDDVDTITLTNVYSETVSLTIIKNIYGLNEAQVVSLVEANPLRFDVDGFTASEYLINSENNLETGFPEGHNNWNDWGDRTFAVKDTLQDEPKFQGEEDNRFWSFAITTGDASNEIVPANADQYTEISMKRMINEEDEVYYRYEVTITDMPRDVWFRVWEMNPVMDGYSLQASVIEYLTGQGDESLANYLTTDAVMDQTKGRGDHGGRATAFLLTSDTTVEFTNHYKVSVELPETGGPGIRQIKEFGWMLLLLAAMMAGVEVQMNRRRRSGR